MRAVGLAMGLVWVVSACGGKDAGGSGTGVAACDKYMKTLDACIAKAPEEAKAELTEIKKQSSAGWRQIHNEAVLEAACNAAWDLVAGSDMVKSCPDVKWD